jgi:glycosyltransferase involved in cell wall biosynthesis
MKVSVIICTYNREKYLPITLEKFTKQTSSYDQFEILIIDNNSNDNTSKLSKEFISNNPEIDCKYILELKQGLSYARNIGIQESKNEILSFIDDDAFVRPEFISNTILNFQINENLAAIGGKIIPVYESYKPKWMSKYLLPLVAALNLGNKAVPFKGNKFPIGANMAFIKSIFEKYGIFDVQLGRKGYELEGGEEKEFFSRLKKEKEIILYIPDVVVDHIIPQKRIEVTYIKGLAVGVGTSEKKRLRNANYETRIKRVLDELLKIGGTFILFFYHLARLEPHGAWMLVRFRIWVIQGFLK